MVISGNNRVRRRYIDTLNSEEEEEDMMERFKPPLHNFDLPLLKWGNQKLLRCVNVDDDDDDDDFNANVSPSFVRRKQLPETSGGGGSVIRTRRKESSDYDIRFPSSSEKFKSQIGVAAGDGEIEATREKLMFDFKKEVDLIKVDILKEQRPVTTAYNSPAERPWNLRTRRAACKAPPSDGVKVNGNGGEITKPNSQPPLTNELTKRKKFSVPLSRGELEDDFMVMTGRRLPRKPKKRPRIVQKQLDVS